MPEGTFLSGYLDEITIRALETPQDAGTLSREEPLTGTMWFNTTTGTVYHFGDGRPRETYGLDDIDAVRIIYAGELGKEQPLGELPPWVTRERTSALETALASIRAYRQR
jgi:hypothetical protein